MDSTPAKAAPRRPSRALLALLVVLTMFAVGWILLAWIAVLAGDFLPSEEPDTVMDAIDAEDAASHLWLGLSLIAATWLAWAAPVIGVVLFALAMRIWTRMSRQYQSAGN